MAKTRLKLDFSLATAEERTKWLNEYIKNLNFIPTDEETEMMGNYLLWGKSNDGKNEVQHGNIYIETSHKTWDPKVPESLDALVESAAFNEASLRNLYENSPRYKTPKEKFSRASTLKHATRPHEEATLKNLFANIDELELLLNYYDIFRNKRTNPPRESLLNKFSEEQRNSLLSKAAKISPYKYLKLRHLLVELRRQQFTLKDSINPVFNSKHPPEPPQQYMPLYFDSDIPVYPLGLSTNSELSKAIFKQMLELNPKSFPQHLLKEASTLYWEKQDINKEKRHFDFTNIEHVYNLLLQYYELEDSLTEDPFSTTADLLKTLKFYIEFAELNEIHSEILNLKMRGTFNQDIANYINKKYSKSYTANYISTIFRQKIIVAINNAATIHSKIIENIAFPENFKACSRCKEIYLREPTFFVKKKKACDGLGARCKKCDKEVREAKKKSKEV